MLITHYAQCRRLQDADSKSANTAAIAFNVKGSDLLFLDHPAAAPLGEDDLSMWNAVRVPRGSNPFGRVIVLVPLADDGFSLNTLRTNPAADVAGYSETRPFALGIEELWPYLDLLFDDRSTNAVNLLAEIRVYFEQTSANAGLTFTLANVLNLFTTDLLKPIAQRPSTIWDAYQLNTTRSVYQRLKAIGATLGGLIDATGSSFGLDIVENLKPFDLVVLDLERTMAVPPDPELADKMLKIVTKHVLQRVAESMTQGAGAVEHVIVFGDELNRLAPAQGDKGVGEYLAHLARTTRDRGIVLFGAGQFRSGINKDILKAAAVHFSMQTPEYELDDAIYKPLTAEFKGRLTALQPGETMLQFPSLRKPVFARFPRPFVMTGSEGVQEFPQAAPAPLPQAVTARLVRLDPTRPVQASEVEQLLEQVTDTFMQRPFGEEAGMKKDLQILLRNVEMDFRAGSGGGKSAWEIFRTAVQKQYGEAAGANARNQSAGPAPAAYGSTWDDDPPRTTARDEGSRRVSDAIRLVHLADLHLNFLALPVSS